MIEFGSKIKLFHLAEISRAITLLLGSKYGTQTQELSTYFQR